MRIIFYILFLTSLATLLSCRAQSPIGLVGNMEFDKEISSLLDFSIPVISVEEARDKEGVLFLDARERPEYEVSHIPGAIHIGYDDWDSSLMEAVPIDREIVVYCSVGYRSEKIGNKLKALGYHRVHNLYGSIFEWVNRDFPVVDSGHQTVRRIHTYNKQWSKWVDNKTIEKVW